MGIFIVGVGRLTGSLKKWAFVVKLPPSHIHLLDKFVQKGRPVDDRTQQLVEGQEWGFQVLTEGRLGLDLGVQGGPYGTGSVGQVTLQK